MSSFLQRCANRFFLAAIGFSLDAEAEELASLPRGESTYELSFERVNYTAMQQEYFGVPDFLAVANSSDEVALAWWRHGCESFTEFIDCGRQGFLCGAAVSGFRKQIMVVLARQSVPWAVDEL
jgi:hypothetical protein